MLLFMACITTRCKTVLWNYDISTIMAWGIVNNRQKTDGDHEYIKAGEHYLWEWSPACGRLCLWTSSPSAPLLCTAPGRPSRYWASHRQVTRPSPQPGRTALGGGGQWHSSVTHNVRLQVIICTRESHQKFTLKNALTTTSALRSSSAPEVLTKNLH